ncbi:MAG: M20 family metallo-hydrolase [Smithellaceae bacterium]|nr:M20 family metallo-hydrolase [Smithellaceae bacterium]NLX51436.1 M20 family metallo-hydrolase [Deltaproteobacteria bacterium]
MIDEKIFERLSRRIDSYRGDMIELQKTLTAVPAVGPANGGDGEMLKARVLKERLVDMGFTSFRHFDAPDESVSAGLRPNFLTSLRGSRKARTVWIITHLDIVPPGEIKLWSADPYTAYVRNNCIYGRGTEDNQQDMVASIFAARAFLDEGIPPSSAVGLFFVADEETSGSKGLYYVLDLPEKIFSENDLIVVPDSGNACGTLIEIAEKSILWLGFKTTGRQCHGSKPQLGINAFEAASRLVTELTQLRGIFNASDPLFDPPASTFEPTKKEANVGNINTIPGEDVFYMDCRILPQYALDDVLAEVAGITKKVEREFSVRIEIIREQYVQSPPPTPADAPVVPALQEAVAAVYSVNARAGGIGAGTVAAYLRKNGLPAAVWSKLRMNAHQPDENCSIDDMAGNAKVFAHLFLQT